MPRLNQRIVTDGIGGKTGARQTRAAVASVSGLPAPKFPGDPRKGRFGGQSQVNGRQITAEVKDAARSPGNYDIHLVVQSTDKTKPLTGSVTFYLHDSFVRPVRHVSVEHGIAELSLLAYGAFTVGAIADDGQTMLELDLAEDPRFPKAFREA